MAIARCVASEPSRRKSKESRVLTKVGTLLPDLPLSRCLSLSPVFFVSLHRLKRNHICIGFWSRLLVTSRRLFLFAIISTPLSLIGCRYPCSHHRHGVRHLCIGGIHCLRPFHTCRENLTPLVTRARGTPGTWSTALIIGASSAVIHIGVPKPFSYPFLSPYLHGFKSFICSHPAHRVGLASLLLSLSNVHATPLVTARWAYLLRWHGVHSLFSSGCFLIQS